MQRPYHVAQIKLNQYFGGGEVFSRFLCEAVDELGGQTLLIVHPNAPHWRTFVTPSTTKLEALNIEEAIRLLPPGVPLITHGPLPAELAERVASERALIGFVHMPLDTYFAKERSAYHFYHATVPVSAYVAQTMEAVGIKPYPAPIYGYADFSRFSDSQSDQPLISASVFEWDRRKGRDYILGLTEPVWGKLFSRKPYKKTELLTIGLVSRIAPIKQFPVLFEKIAPILAKYPVSLEIFGAGGYASIRDLKAALQPIKHKVRFWGHQNDMLQVYSSIDVMLAGLPEREALGLNVLEAQACGVPVVAVNAPPFNETVWEGKTGFLYLDPRIDDGADFARLLDNVMAAFATKTMPDPRSCTTHQAKFSKASFCSRIESLLERI